ncbi:MAG TPA: ABC transporter permease [Candidatus Lustribacter sp.]|nr:ABC transporter permease [Candidatus Lustribacter sp.]
MHPSRRLVVGTLSVAIFLAVWQFVGQREIIRSDLISYPTEVLATFARLISTGELGSNAAITLQEFVEGFIPSIVFGVAFGVLLALIRPLRELLDPLLTAMYTAPVIAFIPILVVWFGVGTYSKVVIVFISAIFPIMINTRVGVSEIAEPWLRAVRSFGADQLQVVTKAILPGSMPAIMAGIRLGLGRAIVGLIAGEMYVSLGGIGRMIQVYSSAARSAEIIVLVVVIAVFGYVCVALMRSLENRLGTWQSDLE